MPFKFGKNKKIIIRATGECTSDILPTCWPFLWSVTEHKYPRQMGTASFVELTVKQSEEKEF